jgi:hypothetical protein
LEDCKVGESEIANEWRAAAAAKASLKTMRTAVLRALAVRVKGSPPPEVVTTVESIDDLDELTRWLETAVVASSLDDFLAAIRRT